MQTVDPGHKSYQDGSKYNIDDEVVNIDIVMVFTDLTMNAYETVRIKNSYGVLVLTHTLDQQRKMQKVTKVPSVL